jgi:hypothetical protein
MEQGAVEEQAQASARHQVTGKGGDHGRHQDRTAFAGRGPLPRERTCSAQEGMVEDFMGRVFGQHVVHDAAAFREMSSGEGWAE